MLPCGRLLNSTLLFFTFYIGGGSNVNSPLPAVNRYPIEHSVSLCVWSVRVNQSLQCVSALLATRQTRIRFLSERTKWFGRTTRHERAVSGRRVAHFGFLMATS